MCTRRPVARYGFSLSNIGQALQHATNCGLLLLQVKASLSHGEWLPWLKQQQESGLIGFSHKTATKYMSLAANMNRDSYLKEAPSIRAALELLTDKESDADNFEAVYKRFGDGKLPIISNLRPTILYALITLYQGVGSDVVKLFDNKKLSQTVSVMLLRSPDSVIDKAVAKAESGEKVTVADVKGWKALGYESFKDYGEKELGYSEVHVYRLVDAAEIGLQIGFSPIGENQPKESQLRPLKSVPEEERKAIWEEATRKANSVEIHVEAQLGLQRQSRYLITPVKSYPQPSLRYRKSYPQASRLLLL